MKFFRKNKQPHTEGTLTTKLNLWIDDKQRKTADFLNTKTQFLRGKILMLALVLFCAVVGSYCLYLITSGF
ncbi:hypothetical protein DBR43_03690 [Pedobacter sp. KBW06]|nr:hypothetical protein DBR43_03690 [Pedobacter sp. KBW06]